MPRRPAHDLVTIDDALGWQERFCLDLGAPRSAEMLAGVRTGLDRLDGMLPAVVRSGDLLGLRVLAALNRLLRTGQVPAVADLVEQDALGTGNPDRRARLHEAVVDALEAHPDVLAEALARVPQTNEPGRAGPLRVALSLADRPVRLHEVGASAGLNLRADHLPGVSDLERGPLPEVTVRAGCDRHPIDATTPEGQAQLEAFVWIDHAERLAALRAACAVAAAVPADVVTADATDFVSGLTLAQGAITVLWHSAFWEYLDADAAIALTEAIGRLAREATMEGPFWQVGWEQHRSGDDFALTITAWDGRPGGPVRAEALAGSAHGAALRALPALSDLPGQLSR
ncbi:MAG: DUF2332 family protein [Actinomycetota bacterium]